jgi:hypothetical protein
MFDIKGWWDISMMEYNVKTIWGCSILIALGIYLWIDQPRHSHHQVAYSIFFCASIIFLIIYMFLFISYRSYEIKGTVTNVSCTGSWAGLMDTYDIDVENDSGEVMRLSTQALSSSSIKKTADSLNQGDRVLICYGGYFHIIYNISVLEPD